ncbi:hypothetical protein JHK82_034846 [Glycine max]|nr:hypothetical protein JHK82_034846 [Glycine max]
MASSTFLHSYSLLLLIILPFLPSVFSATSSNCSANSIHLNSTLVTNHTWNSPSGLFAFGFQNVLSNKEFMSVLAVWFPKDPHRTIVWYAKYKQTSDLGTMHAVSSMQKSLAFPSDSTVKLTNKGIVVYDQNGQEMWHRPKNNSIALMMTQLLIAAVRDGGVWWIDIRKIFAFPSRCKLGMLSAVITATALPSMGILVVSARIFFLLSIMTIISKLVDQIFHCPAATKTGGSRIRIL